MLDSLTSKQELSLMGNSRLFYTYKVLMKQMDLFYDEQAVIDSIDTTHINAEYLSAFIITKKAKSAFKIVPYNIEALDKLLTESLKNNIPASGLHLFGIHQIEEDDASANQRDDELPTLLHFAAKYGLKNLTALLLTCPGALQAYSVCNKHGDFPNGIAEKHGYKDLRQFMDDYVIIVKDATFFFTDPKEAWDWVNQRYLSVSADRFGPPRTSPKP
ncbi:hypothetical protein NDU88_009385 [Pleurodeles waltl]|uniref:DBB domain-containing protein n=1 Tax=Pleurodeles waltl TaxID=8319 RepID=A0AAV7QVM7_PLEWA|nr:hypothetical protein NDU88_009385 [Pleurodeles waltl]